MKRFESWYKIAASADGKPAEVFIYDRIGETYWGDGVGAKNFARELAALDVDELTVRINSPGGSVYDGIAILNALRAHKAKVTVYVDGIAASAASFIAMAGDEIIMSRNAEMMIHDPMMACAGNAADMRETADRLEVAAENIASIYAERAGSDPETFRDAMRAETWYSDQEAVDAGLADRIAPAKPGSDKVDNAFDLSMFNYAGRTHAPAPTLVAAIPAARASADTEAGAHGKEDPMGLKESLAQRLGIAADADEATVISAVDEALEERADGGALTGANVVTVDADRFANLERQAAAGVEALARQEAAATATFLEDAVAQGKFAPSKLDHYEALMKAAPKETRALIDAMPANSIPVAELGTGHDGGDDTQADVRNSAAYKALEGF